MTETRATFDDYFTYGEGQRAEISFPLGGIGTGSIGLSGTGRLVDWEIRNRPDKGSVNGFTHFAIRAERDGATIDTRVLHGPFDGRLTGDIQAGPFRSFGFGVRREYLAGLPNFEGCTFRGLYPVAELDFTDKRFPGDVRLTAMSPMIPNDTHDSSIPVAMFEFEIANTEQDAIDYTLVGALASFESSRQTSSVETEADGRTTLRYGPGADGDGASLGFGASERGEVSLSALDGDISYQQHWYRGAWFDSLQVYWQDVSRPGALVDRRYEDDASRLRPVIGLEQDHGMVASRVTILPGETRRLRFFIAWHFPVFEKYWPSMINLSDVDDQAPSGWKNWYATRWPTVADVEAYCTSNWQDLWSRTTRFQQVLGHSDLPLPVLDAVSANLSVLKSPTVTRLEDGTLYGFEGCHVDSGSCEGSCAHVWNYQQALPFLYPDLARSMLDVEFRHNQDPETGGLGFRLPLPLGVAKNVDRPCADGHFGTVIRTYREWQASGDDAWLRDKWPGVKRAIEFAWHPGNYDRWDPEKTGVLWGRQHHTLDMELFGPNSWLTGFYLGALRAAVRMALHVGDAAVAKEYEEVFDRGRAWVDENLYRDGYFAQSIDLADKSFIDEFARAEDNHPVIQGSISDLYWSSEHGQIKYQIGDGCLIDQTLAQWHATLLGLGDLFEPDKVQSSLRAIYEHNFKEDLGEIMNPCRVFGVAGESGTLICTWPDGSSAPVFPVPYSEETFHGLEYSFGGALMQIGEIEKGIRVFRAVRDRYRGANRNPWNEIECGSNYARSMASFAAVPILSGMQYDQTQGRLALDPKLQSAGQFTCFWSAGGAWGEVRCQADRIVLDVIGGSFTIKRLVLGSEIPAGAQITLDGHELDYERLDGESAIEVGRHTIDAGSTLAISGLDLGMSSLPDVDTDTRSGRESGSSVA